MIQSGHIAICEWQKLVKVIFNQMVEVVDYIHSKNVSHFDISLENFLINDVQIKAINGSEKLSFVNLENVQIKLCDFGLSEYFEPDSSFLSSKYCGKIGYQSPEINYRKKQFNAALNDVWCLGIRKKYSIFGFLKTR